MPNPDATLSEGDTGAYELPVPGNTVYRVLVQGAVDSIQVIAHSGDTPVYVRVGENVVLKDPDAVLLLPGSWVDVPVQDATIKTRTVSFISAQSCVVSVAR